MKALSLDQQRLLIWIVDQGAVKSAPSIGDDLRSLQVAGFVRPDLYDDGHWRPTLVGRETGTWLMEAKG